VLSKAIDYIRSRRELWWTVGAALLISFITRPVTGVGPYFWTEGAWQSGLHQAFTDGIPFGGDGIVFTYGPLGFLELPTYWYSTTGAVAVVVSFLEPAVLAALLIVVLRGRFGWVMALGCAFIALLMRELLIYHPALPLAAVVAALYVVANPRRDWVRALALVGGIVAGYALLGRINAGIMIAAVVVIAVLFCDDRRRNVPIAIGSVVLTFLLGWVASGQALGELPGYVPAQLGMLTDHAQGMPYEGGATWEYPAAAVIFITGFAAAWFTGRNGDRDRRLGLACIWLAFSYLLFKQGFVRHDFHSLYFIEGSTVALLAMPWLASQRNIVLPGLAVMITIYAVSARNTGYLDLVNIPARTKSSVQASRLVVDAERRHRTTNDGLSAILARYAVSPELRKRLRRGTWTVWPAELSVIRAAGGKLKPLPTLQAYETVSGALDRRNAAAVADDARAPDHILYFGEVGEFDRRTPALDAPQTARAIICHYRVDGVPAPVYGYVALTRTPDRCTTRPRNVASVRSDWDSPVVVPKPSSSDSFIYVRIRGVGVHGFEKIRTQLFRAYVRELRYHLGQTGPPAERHRLVPGSAANGIVVGAGKAASIALAPGMALNFPLISAWREDNPASNSKPLTFDFFEQRLNR
jgi:hypothetical protein